ncbi:ribonuclease H-like domain-containing protein [Tanacetum coccineum]
MTGPDVMATSIRNSPTKNSTIDELLAKLLGILGLENSTGDNTNPPSKVTNSSIVHPTAFYTSPNTGGSLYYPNPTLIQQVIPPAQPTQLVPLAQPPPGFTYVIPVNSPQHVQFGSTTATIWSVGPTVTPGQETTLPYAFTVGTLHDPTTGSWNMDTGASSHLNSSVNSLSEIFNTCMYPSISVGDGHSIPVTNTGHSILPTPTRSLRLNNVQFGSTAATIGSVGPTVTPGQETTLPHAFTVRTLHDPTTGSWNMDTGASSHLNSSVNSLSEIFNTCMYPSISVGDGHSIPVTNTGHSILPTPTRSLRLNNVLITPHIVKNLIYVRQFIRDNNCTIEFDAFGFSVKDFLTRRVLLRCDSTGGLYPVTSLSPIPHAFLVSQHTWHQRLGHPRGEVLHRLASSNIISCNKEKPLVLCHACQLGKHVKLPFVSSDTVISSCFDIIHSNVWTSPISSLSGFKYYVLFLDHYSQFVWVYPLVNKSDVMSKFVLFRNYVHTQFKCEIKSFQCDHGGEFDNRRQHTLFAQNEIQFRFSCPQTFQQNGKSERMVRTINNLIRTLLFQANLPPTFWVKALNMAIQLLNILPSTAIANDIPYTRLYGKDPNYTFLRIFRCLCYPHLYRSYKLEPRATPSIFLGFASSHRGYCCLDLYTNKIIISRHVTFDKTVFPYGSTIPKSTSAYTFLEDTFDLHPTIPNPTFNTPTIGQTDPLPPQQHPTEPAPQQSPTTAPPTPAFPSSAQIHSPVQQPSPMAQHTLVQLQFSLTAVSLQTTTVSDQHVPDIIQNPPDGTLSRYKARLVANGSTQLEGVDVDETFSPVVKPGSLQYLTFTRPDISYAVQQVCLHMHDPREPHFSALKQILRYVHGTLDYGLQLFSSSTTDLVAYSDADWASCPTTRRSTSGQCVFLGNNLLSWSSKRQPMLSRSSAEAEYRGVANVVAETFLIAQFTAAVYLSCIPVQHQCTKHIEIDIHFVRDLVAASQVRFLHVRSRYQYADIFTKGLPSTLFKEFRTSLSVWCPPAPTAREF